jgi:hypothetical protein
VIVAALVRAGSARHREPLVLAGRQRSRPAYKNRRLHGMHRSGLGRPSTHEAGFEPPPEGGQLLSGGAGETAGSRRPPRPHTCWARGTPWRQRRPLQPAQRSWPSRHSRQPRTAPPGPRADGDGPGRESLEPGKQRDPMPPLVGARQGVTPHGNVPAPLQPCLGRAVVMTSIAARASAGHARRPHSTTKSHRSTTCPTLTSGPTGPDQPKSTIAPTRDGHAALYFHAQLTIRCRTSAGARTATPRQPSPHPS